MSDVLDRFLAQYHASHPVNATFTGVHAHDHRLPDWSASGRRTQLQEMQALRSELEAAHPLPAGGPAALGDSAVLLDAELARANLDVRMAEYSSDSFHDRNPALWTGEAIFGAASLMIRAFAPVETRLASLRARLDAIPDFLATLRATIAGPVPSHWSARAVRECSAAEQLFGEGLDAWLSTQVTADCTIDVSSRGAGALTPNSRDVGLLSSAVREAARDARLAFAETRRWLGALSPADDSAYASPLFRLLLERGHLCNRDPQQLLEQAERELATEQERLATLSRAQGGGWDDVQQRLADDCPTMDSYLGAFHERWHACRAWAAQHDAVSWPEWPLRYVPIPTWARSAAPSLYWLFYRAPAPFDPYSVYDYVVTPVDATMPADEQHQRLRTCNHSVITLNHVVHHGAIGHHVQNWHAYHRSRSRIGTIAAVDCACRIGMFLGGSMAEGWACYATDLMDELGFLTPLEQVAQQHSRVRMLTRAIVDIRLHSGTLAFPDAVRLYQSEAGLSEAAAVSETTKNSMFPCTALMYWLGTSTIHRLRETVKRERGAAFNLRAFHDELLSWGAIPVCLIEQFMTELRT